MVRITLKRLLKLLLQATYLVGGFYGAGVLLSVIVMISLFWQAALVCSSALVTWYLIRRMKQVWRNRREMAANTKEPWGVEWLTILILLVLVMTQVWTACVVLLLTFEMELRPVDQVAKPPGNATADQGR